MSSNTTQEGANSTGLNLDYQTFVIRKKCGCVVLLVSNDPRNRDQVKQSLDRAHREGWTVETKSRQWVMDHWMEKCEKHSKDIPCEFIRYAPGSAAARERNKELEKLARWKEMCNEK